MRKQKADTVEMTWFELDVAAAHMTDEEIESCGIDDLMAEAIENDTAELTWWEVDAIHQNAQTRRAKRMLAEKADEITN